MLALYINYLLLKYRVSQLQLARIGTAVVPKQVVQFVYIFRVLRNQEMTAAGG
jgi:hypothetical protein